MQPGLQATAVPTRGAVARPVRNRLLADLPREEMGRLWPHLTLVPLAAGQTLSGPGDGIGHLHFVERGIVSLMADTGADDAGIQVAMIGREGLTGSAALLGPLARAFHRATVQAAGSALRLPATSLGGLLGTMPVLRGRCLRYVEALGVQMAQAGACNGRHLLAARCAGWLLAAADRAEDEDPPLTHEVLSSALGVRRAGVTLALSALQEGGLIRTGRGSVAVLDRAGLEQAACGCYRLVRDEFDRLLTCT